MKLQKLTRVQKFIKENNIEVFNAKEVDANNAIIVVTKNNYKVSFTQGVNPKTGKPLLCVVYDENYDTKDFKISHEVCKTQKEMIEKFIKITGIETTETGAEKSTVAPLESPIKITPEVTAMNVTRESESARQLAKLIKLEGNKAYEVLDYGCGLGRNIKYLLENTNCFVDGCDTEEQVKNINKDAEKMAYFKNQASTITTSDKLEGGYEFMLNSHVLNVVMDDVKKIIIDDMYKLLAKNGKLVIQVRTESDVASAKSKEKYGDGWLIKKGKDTTYQEGITKEKMHRMLTGAGFKIINHRFTKSIHMVEVTK